MSYNANVSRTWATLRIVGKALEPEDVTARLGVTPFRSFKAGDKRGTQWTWRHGYWGLESQGHISSTDLELHIEWLLDQVESRWDELSILLAENGIRADVFCFWESATGHGGPSFSPKLMSRLAALNLELGLDIYFAD